MNADEILKNFKNKAETTKVTGSNSLVLLWKKRLSLIDSEYQKPLSGKEVGQLKHVLKAVGPEKAEKCIEYVLAHWSKFSTAVHEQKGLNSGHPNCGFFCAHYEVALQLIAEKEAPAVIQSAPPAVVIKPKAVDTEDLATPEDIAETLEQLKKIKALKG